MSHSTSTDSGVAEKLDYRCRGQGCEEKKECRRFLYGLEAKNSSVQFAAFDARLRDKPHCDGFMARLDADRHNNKVSGATRGD